MAVEPEDGDCGLAELFDLSLRMREGLVHGIVMSGVSLLYNI